MTKRTVDLVVDWMKENRIGCFFGIPGGASLNLIEEADREGIKYILFNNEASASAAAGIWGMLNDTPGICMSIMGPGALNCVFGAGLALMERHPLILFTDRYPSETINILDHQNILHKNLFQSITKDSLLAGQDTIDKTLNEAYSLSMKQPFGAVHIDFPTDIWSKESKLIKDTGQIEDNNLYENSFDTFIDDINNSRNPVIITGLATKYINDNDLLLKLIEKLDAPFLSSYGGKGTIREDHPLYAGAAFGLSNIGSFEHGVLSISDLIILIGVDSREIPRKWGYKQKVLSIDYTDNKIKSISSWGKRLIGDIDYILCTIFPDLRKKNNHNSKYIRMLWKQVYDKIDDSDQLLSAEGVISITRNMLSKDSIISSDTGVFNMLLGHLWKCYKPRTFLNPSCTTTMGFSLPAIIAASLTFPKKQLLAFCGDGSMLMRLGDLEILSRIGSYATIVIFNDNGLGTIKYAQKQLNTNAKYLDYNNVSFSAIGLALGIESFTIKNHLEYRESLKRSLESNKLSVIEVLITSENYDQFIPVLRNNMVY